MTGSHAHEVQVSELRWCVTCPLLVIKGYSLPECSALKQHLLKTNCEGIVEVSIIPELISAYTYANK